MIKVDKKSQDSNEEIKKLMFLLKQQQSSSFFTVNQWLITQTFCWVVMI